MAATGCLSSESELMSAELLKPKTIRNSAFGQAWKANVNDEKLRGHFKTAELATETQRHGANRKTFTEYSFIPILCASVSAVAVLKLTLNARLSSTLSRRQMPAPTSGTTRRARLTRGV